MSIVPTNVFYTYDMFRSNLNTLKQTYPFLQIQMIGSSVLGKQIPCIRIGNGSKHVLYAASFHANEWITTPVLMKFIEDFCISYTSNTDIYGYSPKEIFSQVTIHLVPMVNPDGVDLVTGNLSTSSSAYLAAKEIARLYPSIPFPDGWKANIVGVDLNLQFPADWYKAKQIKYSQGFTSPAPRDFVGEGPLTEPEAFAIYDYALSYPFVLMLAYHTQGKEIYWKYQNYLPERSYFIAQQFSNTSGYILSETPYNSSFAGFKDWFISYYNKPGYTIEAGLGENPLPISQFDEIYQDNLGILVLGAILA